HARYHDRLGMRLLRAGESGAAEKAHRKAFDLQTQLVKQHPNVVAYQFWLSLMERSLGKALSDLGQLSHARTHLKNATDRAEALRKKAPHLGGVLPFLGMAYRDLADALSRSGEPEAAAEALRKSAEFGPPGRGPGPPGR